VLSIRGSAPALEVRSAPQVAVALAGSAATIVTVTAEDAAAYDENWEGGSGGHKTTPKALASYWVALLQDELGLFVLHQRPILLVQMSARGKVLTDLFADAVRRNGADAGIPMMVVNPLPPGLAKSFRELALIVPAEGQGSAAAALEGTWAGTWDEPGSGTKEIDVGFRVRAGKLAGSLTTRAGGIEMEMPLKDATFDKGLVRFTLRAGASEKHFSGALEGVVISGTVQSSDAKEAGRFSLHFSR
jgi:hypothetical protein